MLSSRTDPDLLAVARGDRPADLLLSDARVVNVFTRTIEPASIAIFGGRIAAVGEPREAERVVDLGGAVVAPGFIDAHMHVESTMLLPAHFAQVAVPHGTTGVILDPHEIANVMGVAGIRFLIEQSVDLPMHAWFTASSCVPASNLETAAAVLEAEDLRPLLEEDCVIALAEMMNFPGVVHGDPAVLAKVRLGLEAGLVDGHAPGLGGAGLQAYAAAGIASDHECTRLEEAQERIALGMRVYIREGSAARNLEALLPAVTPANAHRFCFCTDDRHPGDLIRDGHIDHVVRKAIGLGLDPPTAFAMASLHTADHYRLPDVGAIAPGRCADLLVFDDMQTVRCRRVYCRGVLVAENGSCTAPITAAGADPPGGGVHLPELDDRSFIVPATGASEIRVVGVDPHQIVTDDLRRAPTVRGGAIIADVQQDLMKLAVIERHEGNGNIGIGFAHGFGLQRGALASTVGHDAHNLIVVGASDGDMLVAARALAECGGGQCVVIDGTVAAVLPLPVAGLLSREPAETVVRQQAALHAAARETGCPMDDPFMPLSFLSLSVIPSLKVTDQGVVDVNAFQIVPLEVDNEAS